MSTTSRTEFARSGSDLAWLDVNLESSPDLEPLRQSLLRMATEVAELEEFLKDVADEAYVPEAEETFEAAQRIPLKPETLARKRRSLGKTTRAKEIEKYFYANRKVQGPVERKRTRRYRRRNLTHVSTSTSVLNFEGGPSSMYGGLTLPFDQGEHSNVARREILGPTLVWGTKGLLAEHADFHARGTGTLPARLIGILEPERNPQFTEAVRHIWAAHLSVALRRAGAPPDWIDQVLGDYA